MSYQVELTSRAQRDLDGILGFLVSHSKRGATNWLRRWDEVVEQLTATPETCNFAPENEDHDEEIRHVLFKTRRGKTYRALFIIRNDTVFILYLRGPGQNLMKPDEIRFP